MSKVAVIVKMPESADTTYLLKDRYIWPNVMRRGLLHSSCWERAGCLLKAGRETVVVLRAHTHLSWSWTGCFQAGKTKWFTHFVVVMTSKTVSLKSREKTKQSHFYSILVLAVVKKTNNWEHYTHYSTTLLKVNNKFGWYPSCRQLTLLFSVQY